MAFDRKRNSLGEAEIVAAEALGYIAANPELIARFLDLTGIEPSQIRRAAQEPGFLAGVLDFLMRHEPDLMAFAAESGRKPESVARAHALLSGGDAGA